MDEETVQWIKDDSSFECCDNISDYDILSHFAYASEETRNFEECSEIDEENRTI